MKKINPNGVAALAMDVRYLVDFVDSLEVPILKENLDELQQTVLLMQAESQDEYYDASTRNKKYGRVDAMNGPILLEKYEALIVEEMSETDNYVGSPTPFRAPPRTTNLAHFRRGWV